MAAEQPPKTPSNKEDNDEPHAPTEVGPTPFRSMPPLDDAEERMRLEAELAALDAARSPFEHRRDHVEAPSDAGMAALAALEARLGNLEL